jgi:flagellum-specific peptidoglycan hydrolase FlgJ
MPDKPYHLSKDQQTALEQAVIDAQASERSTGLWTSISVAQWALESAFGVHAPGCNPFGIKYPAPGCSGWQLLWTHEFVVRGRWPAFKAEHPEAEIISEHMNGQMLRIKCQAKFSVFPTLKFAFDVHGKLLTADHHYAAAFDEHKDDKEPFAYLQKIAPVYATDPQYYDKVASFIKGLDLTRFDRTNSPVPSVTVTA